MRRLAALLVLAASAALASAGPLRVGLEFGNPSGVLVLRPGVMDIKLGYDFTALGSESESPFLHLSIDYRLVDGRPLIDFLHLFIAAGGYLEVLTGDAEDQLVLGGRVPVGLQAFLGEAKVEVFIEVVPTVQLLPTIALLRDWQGFLGFTIAIPPALPPREGAAA